MFLFIIKLEKFKRYTNLHFHCRLTLITAIQQNFSALQKLSKRGDMLVEALLRLSESF